MKAIQIMLDEKLLQELDATEEVQREGRSAVLRRALGEYLSRRRKQQIRERYRRAYASDEGLAPEFDGWANEGTWPDE
jgi:metal-responsive CopG/Arc/MetJ family transcriptional regulator